MGDDYGPIRPDEDLPAVAEMLSWSFNFPVLDAEQYIHKSGVENFRVLRQGARPVACLLMLPMGQFFGGRRVPMAGVGAVATPPDKRGTGAATALMAALLEELVETNFALSTLYPATRLLYRRSGFEPAGGRFMASVPLRTIRLREHDLELRPMTEADREEVVSVHRAQAIRTPGNLDSGEYVWSRVMSPRGENARGFVCGRGGRIEGYAVLFEKRSSPDIHYDLELTDLVAITPEAGRRLLTFLADHGTLAVDARWHTGPGDVFIQMLAEPGYELRLRDHWMMRVVDVKEALARRGYLDAIETELHFQIRDELVPANDGRFVLEIAAGRGEVRRGGRGRIQLHIRGLAPLYSGYLSPHALEAADLLEATDGELAKAAAAFAGPFPWMTDMF